MKFTILEPMSTGDVIDRAVRLYRRNFTSLIAIVAVPTLIGYLVSLVFWYGYASLVMTSVSPGRVPADAVLMLIIGTVGYPLWMFTLLMTICGLSRVVGDNLMMGEPITFRRCFASVRGKVGSIIALGLLIMALMMGVYVALVAVIIVMALIIGLAGGLIAAMHLPQWAIILLMTIVILLAIAAAMFIISFILARVVFMPQVLMIEGESVGSSLGRAFRLGKGNWYRVMAIILFTYFISLSLMGALSITTGIILYLTGFIGATTSLTDPLWNILYTSFRDISSMLALPIWIVSFTLLYFDSRVRKEAYDVELLAREVAPGYVWQAAPAFAGFYPPRQYVQTGPLGLGGYYPPAPQTPAPPAPPPVPQPTLSPAPQPAPPAPFVPPAEPTTSAPGDELRARFEQAARSINDDGPAAGFGEAGGPPVTGQRPAWCPVCGTPLEPGSRFCSRCGTAVQSTL